MNEIKCPNCGQVFSVDEAGYSAILSQVRTEEFERELKSRIEMIEDEEKMIDISRRLSYKFTKDEAYIEDEIRRSGPRTLLFALVPEYMTGKLVKES